MKRKLCIFIFCMVIFNLFPINISYGTSLENKIYLDINLTRPLVQNNIINLESTEGFVQIGRAHV